MKSREIREAFLRFFEGKGHVRVPSAPVVPQDDPTLYFTNAGMNQFKDVFLGLGRRDYTRAVDTQKVVRVSGKHNDLDEVGYSPWHHTFFEMLGNWSFGDYFKKEAIEWSWELITECFGLEKERLWATVFVGDDAVAADADAEALWYECTGLLPGRVVRLPAKENFWEMGATGPCGPCSEIHYYLGDDLAAQDRRMILDDTGDLVEIWNLVFIQYNRDERGCCTHCRKSTWIPAWALSECAASYRAPRATTRPTSFSRSSAASGELTGKEYRGEHRIPMQVVADHVRALSFAMADGAMPANEGRGYVLRRILRPRRPLRPPARPARPLYLSASHPVERNDGPRLPGRSRRGRTTSPASSALRRKVLARRLTAAWTSSRSLPPKARSLAAMPSNSTTPTVSRWT